MTSERHDPSAPTGSAELGSGSDGLALQARGALGWSFLNTMLARSLTFVTGLVLARLLQPQDYGEFAVALVVINALYSANELGVTPALIRYDGDPRRIGPTVVTIAAAGSLAFAGVDLLLAPLVASSLGAPQATAIVRFMALAIVIDGVASVPAAMLARSFQQRTRLYVDLAGIAVSSITTLGLASTDHGAWSLAIGQVLGNVTTLVLFLIVAPMRFRPGFDRAAAREVLSLGVPLAASSFLVFAVLNIDNIVIGGVLGPVSLGFYVLAFNLSSWPVTAISVAIRRVALPFFSRLQREPEELSRAVGRSVGALLAVTVPVCGLLGALSLPVISVVYGTKWAPSAAALTFLAVLGGCRVLFELLYDLLVAKGRGRATFALQACWLAALVPALWIGAHWRGIGGVALGHATVAIVLMTPLFCGWAVHAGVSWRHLRLGATPPLVGLVALLTIIWVVRPVVSGPLATLVVAGGSALLAYALVVLLLGRRALAALSAPAANASVSG